VKFENVGSRLLFHSPNKERKRSVVKLSVETILVCFYFFNCGLGKLKFGLVSWFWRFSLWYGFLWGVAFLNLLAEVFL
jgi:hypothetical protein